MRLEELIKNLTDIYNEHGNLTVEIMRDGVHLPEIELYVDGNFLYLEAYEEGGGVSMNIKNREQIIEQLTEMLIQFDKDMNGYQTDVYLYYNKENQIAELNTFVNVGGNSWLDDDHYTIYTDKEHYETVWNWFNNSTEIADVLEYPTYTEFDYDVRQALEIEADEDIAWEDYIVYVKSNDDYMEKIYAAYKECIDDMRFEYAEKAEEIMKQFEDEMIWRKYYEKVNQGN